MVARHDFKSVKNVIIYLRALGLNINPALTSRVGWDFATQTVQGEMAGALPLKLSGNRHVLI